MKRLVATLCQGENHERIGKVTQPEMLRYARKCGAKFTVCSATDWPAERIAHPWQKLMHLWELLDEWDQVLFLDNDALINADSCPNLFDVVPRTHVGAFKEGTICQRLPNLINTSIRNGIPWGGRLYNGDYINTGVMLLSHLHRDMFVWPDVLQDDYYEQSYINARLYGAHVPIHELSYKFNRMSVLDPITGEQRHGSHIVHFAGSNDYPAIEQAMREDLAKWKNGVEAETNLVIECTGGIGDVVYAEPIIRHMIETTYYGRSDVKFHISTQRPRIFQHFDYPNVTVREGTFEFDSRERPTVAIKAHPAGSHLVRAFCPYQATHNLDFQANAMLCDYMPPQSKTVRLEVTSEDRASVITKLFSPMAIRQPRGAIAVHAGMGWESKTFPLYYWQAIVDRLSKAGFAVILFGQSGMVANIRQGSVPVECPAHGVDLRDKLSLGEMFALIKMCPKLLTNESAPVCVAGAFDNEIYLIANPKAPELVFPYRMGRTSYKTHAIKAPLLSSQMLGLLPNDPGKVSIAKIPAGYEIEHFLPTVDEVIQEVCR